MLNFLNVIFATRDGVRDWRSRSWLRVVETARAARGFSVGTRTFVLRTLFRAPVSITKVRMYSMILYVVYFTVRVHVQLYSFTRTEVHVVRTTKVWDFIYFVQYVRTVRVHVLYSIFVLSKCNVCRATVRVHVQLYSTVLQSAPPLRVGSWEKEARRGRVFSLKSTDVRVLVQKWFSSEEFIVRSRGPVFTCEPPNAFHWLNFRT